MIEIGILSFEMALNEKSEQQLEELKKSFEHIEETPDEAQED